MNEWSHFGRAARQAWRDAWESRSSDRIRGMFGRGDLKYLILDTLKDQPRHGYDVIRELEQRSAGLYTPSAGAVYPMLQLLEDMGAVTSEQRDGRKIYTMTDEGRRMLQERRDVVDDIAARVRDWMRREGGSELQQAMREMGELMALLGKESGCLVSSPEKLRAVREVIARAREELQAVLRDSTAPADHRSV